MINQIDPKTLALVACIGDFILAATMTGMRAAGGRNQGLSLWALAGAVYGLGYLSGHLLLTSGLGVRPWLAGGIANALIASGHVLLLLGVQRHLGRPAWWWALGLPPLMLALLALPEYRQFPRAFLAESLLMVTACVAAGSLLWRARAPELTRYRQAAAAVFLLFAVFLAVRSGWLMLSREVTGSFDPHLFQVLVFLGGMLFAFVLTIAFVVLVFRGKELDLREAARRDALTGLLNRHALQELAQRELAMARRQRASLSLIAIDVDHFKQVNDRHGHAAGDSVLEGVARILTPALRESDLLFRVGGEEFLVLLPFTGLAEAGIVAERLRSVIAAGGWQAPALGRITASLGVAQMDPEGESWELALQRVDQALYAAKAAGRNRVMQAAPTDRPLTGKTEQAEADPSAVGETNPNPAQQRVRA